jgi:predicted esterase
MHTSSRLLAFALILFTVFSSALAGASSRDEAGSESPVLPETEPPDVVYPPDSVEGAAPVTVFLHGMCDTPENECPYFRRSVGRRGWLVCPRAPNACGDGGSRWGSKGDAALVEAAVERLTARYPGRVSDRDRTIMGFSQGAFVAADILQRSAQPYRYAVLIAGRAPLEAARVVRGGALRVLLSAGDQDGSAVFMRSATRRLARGGVDAQFFSLGNVGHSFAADMDTWLESALAWLWAPGHAA